MSLGFPNGRGQKRKADDVSNTAAASTATAVATATAAHSSVSVTNPPEPQPLTARKKVAPPPAEVHDKISFGATEVRIDSMQGRERSVRQDAGFAFAFNLPAELRTKERISQILNLTCKMLSDDIDTKDFAKNSSSTLSLGYCGQLEEKQLSLATAQIGDSSIKILHLDKKAETVTTAFNCRNEREKTEFIKRGGSIFNNGKGYGERVGGFLDLLTALGLKTFRFYGLTATAEIKIVPINPLDKIITTSDGYDDLGDKGIEAYLAESKSDDSGLCKHAHGFGNNDDDTTSVIVANPNDVVFGVFDANGPNGHLLAEHGRQKIQTHFTAAVDEVLKLTRTAESVKSLIVTKTPKTATAATSASSSSVTTTAAASPENTKK